MRADHPVADRDPGDPVTQRDHFANPLGQRHAILGLARPIGSRDDVEIAMAKAGDPHLDDRFAGRGDGVGLLDQAEGIEPRLIADDIGLHGRSWKKQVLAAQQVAVI